jgi:hypothetical protein
MLQMIQWVMARLLLLQLQCPCCCVMQKADLAAAPSLL